ncbi:univin [Procambarus clarkii]|uniref:univin n=1 Tax=Procambarus clarkii TaxID=6728 RepID=UPI0037442A41
MKVISVTVVGALLLLPLLQRAAARATTAVNPQYVFNRGSNSGLPEVGGVVRDSLTPHAPHPLRAEEDATDVAEDSQEDEEDDEDEDDDQDFEWSAEDLDMIKQKILDGLGLTAIPLRSKANVTREEYDEAYTEYMRLVKEEEARSADSYSRDDEDEGENEDEDGARKPAHRPRRPTVADYRFFSTGVTHQSRRGRRSAGVEGQVVHFHVAVPVRRVYHHDHDVKQATCRLWKTGGPVPHDPAHDTVTVTLYQMNNLNRKRRRRKQEPVLIQSLNVSVAGDEWLSVDVTDTVRDWLGTPRDDAGVLVQCPDCGAAGVTIHTGANSSNTTYVPTLDVQTQVPAGRRMKRSPQMKRATDATWRRRGDCRDMNSSGRPRRSRCCRRSMKVRFKDLPDFDFVESPANFDAFYCSGRCPPRFNPANEHALLQSLIKLKHKKNIPRPCCAPTALKGLHILHFNDQGKLTTTYWDDMIVTECGCA